MPKTGVFEIGDAMQFGLIKTKTFGRDRYTRLPRVTDGNTLIDPPPAPASVPEGELNPFYVAHQEWYPGASVPVTSWETAATLRNAQTGGFPGGMLRMSECVDLPGEATCGLTAITGFNSCVANANAQINKCFTHNTAYAGLRACDAATPCRDDYICLRPIGYNATNGEALFEARKTAIYGGDGPPQFAFGEKQPDSAWLSRDDGAGDLRGYCMPPYFVLQFRLDGHPSLPPP